MKKNLSINEKTFEEKRKEQNEIVKSFRQRISDLNGEIKKSRATGDPLPQELLNAKNETIDQARNFLDGLKSVGIVYPFESLKWLEIDQDDPILKNPYEARSRRSK